MWTKFPGNFPCMGIFKEGKNLGNLSKYIINSLYRQYNVIKSTWVKIDQVDVSCSDNIKQCCAALLEQYCYHIVAVLFNHKDC